MESHNCPHQRRRRRRKWFALVESDTCYSNSYEKFVYINFFHFLCYFINLTLKNFFYWDQRIISEICKELLWENSNEHWNNIFLNVTKQRANTHMLAFTLGNTHKYSYISFIYRLKRLKAFILGIQFSNI